MRNAGLLLPLLAAPLTAQVDEVAVLAQFKADAKLVVSDLKAATVAPKAALIDAIAAAKKEGAPPEQLVQAQELQRKAQWRLDFIAAENSMGFHAPQEAAKVLGEAIDYARQGELAMARLRTTRTAAAPLAPAPTGQAVAGGNKAKP